MNKSSDDELSEGYFRWRCRRGMKELDFIFNNFITGQFSKLSQSEKTLFNDLLNEEDMLLWYWLSGKRQPENQNSKYLDLLEEICAAGYHKK